MNIATVETTDDHAAGATAVVVPDGLFEARACCCAALVQTDETDDVEPAPERPAPYEVRVIRSANRRKTTSARLFGNVLEVRIPSWLSLDDEQQVVADYVERFEKRRRCWEIDLAARARDLAGAHDLPEPRSIRWSNRQRMRWGSCNQSSGEILISHRLAEVPRWVLDYVIVHELAHLVVRGHPPAFHRLVARYPRAERAAGYLEAVGDLVE